MINMEAVRLGGVPEQVLVTDAGDPRLADHVKLTDVHLRRSLCADVVEDPTDIFR
jgi:hypothetical protein